MENVVVIARAAKLHDPQVGPLPLDAVDRLCVRDHVERPRIVGALIPHLEDALLLVVHHRAHDDDVLVAANLLRRLQLDDRIVVVLGRLIQRAENVLPFADDVVVGEKLLAGPYINR